MLLCFWDNGFGNRKPTPGQEHPRCYHRTHPDRIQITFDDHRLVANAGLALLVTLARHLRMPQLVQQRLDLGMPQNGPTPATS